MDGRGTHSVLELCGQSVVCVAQVARVGVVLCSFNLVFWCSVLQDLREQGTRKGTEYREKAQYIG